MRFAVAVACAALVTGCQKVAREKLDFGPEVSKAEINAALAVAMNGVVVTQAHPGQGVAYVTTRRIGDSDSETTLSAATMSTVADPSSAGRLKLLIDTTARAESGSLKTTRDERTLTLQMNASQVAAQASTDPAPPTEAAPMPAPAPHVSYHRLRTATETLRAPAPLRARENCAGLPDCSLSVRYVLFEVLAQPAGGPVSRVSVMLGFSTQTPYLPYGQGFDLFNGALVIDCRTSNVTIDGRRVPVHECRRLVDFQN